MSDPGPAARGEWMGDVVSRYEAPLVRYAARITGDVERGRDAVQSTFLKLCKEDAQALDGHLAEWLFTVCRNQALDVRRKESRMNLLSDVDAANRPSRDPPPGEECQTRETLAQVLALMATLPDNQQEVLRLKFQNGFSYREISGITRLSVTNVGFLIHTGLKTLRTRLTRSAPRLAPGT